MSPRLAVVGMGKLGRTIADLAVERGWDVVARIGRADAGAGITTSSLKGAQVAIEVSTPGSAADNARALIRAGCPVVVGTTGWYDALPALDEWTAGSGGALLTAPNFSLGVNLFARIAERAAELLSRAPGFDAHLIEIHHAAKKDAPSGTALMVDAVASTAWGREIPITSVRTGSVPGTHELIFDAAFETIRLSHAARDRRAFAEGALVAAAWLIGKTGVFTMTDVLDTPTT